MKKALITGITGQDGSYLAEFLLEKGYEVHGIIRRCSTPNTANIDHIIDKLHLHYGDMSDGIALGHIVRDVQPDEVYHLAAMSQVRVSFEIPEHTGDIDALGTLRMLEACRGRDIKFYQASTSELYGLVQEVPQTEKTPFHPRSPYGIAKLYAYWAAVNYRESYDMFVCNGILFNHESPRRGETFVSRKIVKAALRIAQGQQDKLLLGNLDAKRDWGFAGDFVEAMWLMLQQSESDDYVIATGEAHSIKEFLDEAFGYFNLDWNKYVEIDSKLFRPSEIGLLLGNSSKAKKILGWEPKVKFKELVHMMVSAEERNGAS